jgi:anaerobic magnesium-protoporphyrin IX monomethyl ester cyclase
MKVLLIYPSIDCPPVIHHGLASLSAVLKSRGHETRLIHINESLWPIPSNEEILEIVRDYRPGLIGLSVMSRQYEWTCRLARDLRARFPQLPLCIGGVHAALAPEEVEASALFDYLCVGEGEIGFPALVDGLERRTDVSGCPAMRVRGTNGGFRENPVGPLPDLDGLPPPDWDLFDLERISQVKRGWISLLTSRRSVDPSGAATGPIRHRSVPSVLAEIRRLKERLPELRTLVFDDDLLTLDRRYLLHLCAEYRRAGIGLPFVATAHLETFDEEAAQALKEAGCRICRFELESGSERIRRQVLGRRLSDRTIERALTAAQGQDLHTCASILFGLPTEGREEAHETLGLCARLKPGRLRWTLFVPFPGARGAGQAREIGLVEPARSRRPGGRHGGGSLSFGPEHDLWLDKVSRVAHWWVNALSDWPSARLYRALVEEIERLDHAAWQERKRTVREEDREISEELLEKTIPHYSIRYTSAMAVHSDFVLQERERLRLSAAAGFASTVA